MSVSNTKRSGIIGFGLKQATGVAYFSHIGLWLGVGKAFQRFEALEKCLGIGDRILLDIFFQGAAYEF